MNAEVENALVIAAQNAVRALREDAPHVERTVVQLELDQALRAYSVAIASRRQAAPDFDGPAYDPEYDSERLSIQLGRIYECMRDQKWRTLAEIHAATKDSEASISAQLRHLRKPRFGTYRVERRHRGEEAYGLYEYRVLPPVDRIQHTVPDISDLKGVAGEFKQTQIL